MINVNKTMADMARMSDAQLKQTAVMNKTDPYFIALLSGESARRQALRQGAQAGAQEQPTVVDQTLAQMDAGQAQAMPEDQGIAQLRTPNMETMAAAEGGIVGYADGGMVAFAPGGTTGNKRDAFLAQYGPIATKAGAELGVDPKLLLAQWGHETDYGTKTVGKFNLGNIKDMTGKGPTAVDRMEKSKASYRTYESPDAFAADYVAQMKRNFPGALNTGADADKFTAGLQEGRLGAYATDPNYEKGVKKTFASIATDALPIGAAQAAPSGIATVAPAAGQGRIDPYAASTAVAGVASLPGVGVAPIIAKEALAAQFRPGTTAGQAIGRLGTAGIAVPLAVGIGGAEAARNATGVMAAMPAQNRKSFYENPMIGAMGGDASLAAAIMNAAEEKPDPNAKPPMSYADQMANVGKFIVGHPDVRDLRKYAVPAEAKPIDATAAAEPGRMAAQEDFRRREMEDQAKAESPLQALAPKAEAPAATVAADGEKPSWLTNDRALMLGLNLLAQQGKPGSGSAIRDLLGGLGTAGLSTLAGEKTDALQKAQEKYYTGLGKKSEAEATSYASGNRMLPQAMTAANAAYDDWFKSLSPIQKLELKPGQTEAKRQEFLQSAMAQFRIPTGAGSSSQLSTADQSLIAKYT